MKDQAICWLNYSVLWVLGVPLHLGVFPFLLILQNLKLMRNTAGRAGSVNNICGWAAADMEIKCGDLTPFPWDIPYMAKCMLKPLQRTEFECFQGRLLLILHHGEGPFCSWLYQRTPSQLYKDIVGPVWCEGTRVAWTEPWPQPYWTPFGVYRNPSCMPGPRILYWYRTSQMLFWLNGHKFQQPCLLKAFPGAWRRSTPY